MATPAMPQAPLEAVPGSSSLTAAAVAAAAAAAAAQDRKKRKECEYESCTIVPVFNFPNESSGRFCKAHRCAPRQLVCCSMAFGMHYDGVVCSAYSGGTPCCLLTRVRPTGSSSSACSALFRIFCEYSILALHVTGGVCA